jgi:hypothetical protein
MVYKAKGNNSHLDSIRADIAEMLNLQANKLLHERTLMNPIGQQEKNLESIHRAHLTISARLNELLDKYNIT